MSKFKTIGVSGKNAKKIAEAVNEELNKEENKGYDYHDLVYQGNLSLKGLENILVLKEVEE